MNPQTADDTKETEETKEENPEPAATDENDSHRFDWQYDIAPYYPEEDDIEGDYIFNETDINGNIIVLKRSVHTGECTPVCTDPFCTHDNPNCRFHNSMYVKSIGNTMYAIKIDEGDVDDKGNLKNSIYSYNVDTDEYKTIFEKDYPIRLSEMRRYGRYLYFEVSGRDDGLKRLDVFTEEVISVKRQSGYRLFGFTDNMIIWIPTGSTGDDLATDLEGNDPKPYNPVIYAGRLHECVVVNNNMPGMYISWYISDKNGERERMIIEKCLGISRAKNNRLYLGLFDDLEKHPIIPDKPEEGKMKMNGDVYILPYDTEEARLLCHIDNVSLDGFYSGGYNDLKTGDWFGIMIRPTQHYLEENNLAAYDDGIRNMSAERWVDNDMVIVNIKTGEYVISRYME
ncbi:MAG: hypothetical protein J5585_11515 [Clostridia bacterium]|nr:hypothetical protein [Clostridia bacterium]